MPGDYTRGRWWWAKPSAGIVTDLPRFLDRSARIIRAMARFVEYGSVGIEVPDDWTDRSTATWAEPPRSDGGLGAVIMLARDVARPDDTLENRIVWALRKTEGLPQVVLLERNPFQLPDGTQAMQLLVEWAHPAGKMIELVSLFLRRGIFWSFVASVPSARLDELDPIMQRVLGSFTTVPDPRESESSPR